MIELFKAFTDFKIQDATTSRTQWLINGLGLECRCLRGKSKVKISIWMQDNAAAKRYLSVWFFHISFAGRAKASFKKVHEMLCLCLIEEIIDEVFVLLYEAYRPSNLPFPHSADFWVEKRNIPLLLDALRMPPVFQCHNGTICDVAEGLCIRWLHSHMSKTLLN